MKCTRILGILRMLLVCAAVMGAGCATDAMRVRDFPVKADSRKSYVDAEPRKISIKGTIGEGPHWSEVEQYPGKIVKAKLKKSSGSNPLSGYGTEIIGGSEGKDCYVWCRFSGQAGATAVAKFWLYVRHESP